ncbi:MAG: DUF4878 domain-containing protein [Ruminococcus sp.]|nr:DUF4878 domain-containing protein [Ruminococcus sp.]
MTVIFASASCTQPQNAEKVVKGFFKEFETSNFDQMKQYCTDSFVKDYFHDGDVYSIKNATLKKCDKYQKPSDYADNLECYYVTVSGEITDNSSLDKDSNEYSFFIVLENNDNCEWKIQNFYSGL